MYIRRVLLLKGTSSIETDNRIDLVLQTAHKTWTFSNTQRTCEVSLLRDFISIIRLLFTSGSFQDVAILSGIKDFHKIKDLYFEEEAERRAAIDCDFEIVS